VGVGVWWVWVWKCVKVPLSLVVVDGMLLDLYCMPRWWWWWCHGCVFERAGGRSSGTDQDQYKSREGTAEMGKDGKS
jgi:hypothetical protein